MNLELLTSLFEQDPRIESIQFTRNDAHNIRIGFSAWDDTVHKSNLIEVSHVFNPRGDNDTLRAYIARLLTEIEKRRRELWGIDDNC